MQYLMHQEANPPRKSPWVFLNLTSVVLVLLGSYRYTHGGTDLLLLIGVQCFFTITAFQRVATEDPPRSLGSRVFFVILSIFWATMILITVSRNGLRF